MSSCLLLLLAEPLKSPGTVYTCRSVIIASNCPCNNSHRMTYSRSWVLSFQRPFGHASRRAQSGSFVSERPKLTFQAGDVGAVTDALEPFERHRHILAVLPDPFDWRLRERNRRGHQSVENKNVDDHRMAARGHWCAAGSAERFGNQGSSLQLRDLYRLLEQKLRINPRVVPTKPEKQMRAGRSPSGPDAPQKRAPLYLLPRVHFDIRQMKIHADQAIAVIHKYGVALEKHFLSHHHRARRDSDDRASHRRRIIDPHVWLRRRLAVETAPGSE